MALFPITASNSGIFDSVMLKRKRAIDMTPWQMRLFAKALLIEAETKLQNPRIRVVFIRGEPPIQKSLKRW
jgi:hypothetical protein